MQNNYSIILTCCQEVLQRIGWIGRSTQPSEELQRLVALVVARRAKDIHEARRMAQQVYRKLLS